jgi:restriction system protein
MSETRPTPALTAFEMLLEEIEDEVEATNRSGARAFERGDIESARVAIKRADQLKEIRHKVAALRDEWDLLLPSDMTAEQDQGVNAQEITERRNLGRLQRGLRTPEKAYYTPILKALVEMGGSARMSDALTRVEQIMRSTLKPVDYDLLNSTAEPRWRNTGQWARDRLVRNGFMKVNSPHGVWEISDTGRRQLAGSDV